MSFNAKSVSSPASVVKSRKAARSPNATCNMQSPNPDSQNKQNKSSLLDLRRYHSRTPPTPTTIQTFLLSLKIIPRLPLILILNNTSTNINPLLRLVLNNTTQPNNFLPEIPRLLVIMAIRRDTCPLVTKRRRSWTCSATCITPRSRPLISLTVNLELNLLRSKTALTTPALNALAAFTNAST